MPSRFKGWRKIKIRSLQRPRCGFIIREVIFESGWLKKMIRILNWVLSPTRTSVRARVY